MTQWPKSLPDYRWPDEFSSGANIAVSRVMSAVFHIACFIGAAIGAILLRIRNYDAAPTLVIRTDGLGDALLFEPALESLARLVSPSEVHLWAPRASCELFIECPTITRRLVIPRGGKDGNLRYFNSLYWRARLGFELGRWSFERVIYPVQSPEPLGNWLFISARAGERWINWGDTDNQFDWQQSQTHDQATRVLETRPGSAHELARNEYLADQWSEEQRLRSPRVHLNQKAAQESIRLVNAWRRAATRHGATELVGLVVAGTSKVNRYPADHWAAALHRLWEEQRVMAILLGGPDDSAALDEVAARLNSVPHFRLMRPVHVLTMSAIIRQLDGVLSVDTGLAHVAVAQRVPSVVLVGGGSPGRFFPWPNGRDHVVLNVSMPCDGCRNRCHLSEPFCVTRIASDDIVEAYTRLRSPNLASPFLVPAKISAAKYQAAG